MATNPRMKATIKTSSPHGTFIWHNSRCAEHSPENKWTDSSPILQGSQTICLKNLLNGKLPKIVAEHGMTPASTDPKSLGPTYMGCAVCNSSRCWPYPPPKARVMPSAVIKCYCIWHWLWGWRRISVLGNMTRVERSATNFRSLPLEPGPFIHLNPTS